MNEISNIINDNLFLSNDDLIANELQSSYEQIEYGTKSMRISTIQVRQILNVLNSQFYNSSNSTPDTEQPSIKLYYDLFQSLTRTLKLTEFSFQNSESIISEKNNEFKVFYTKFITHFIDLLMIIDLPKEVFIPICNFFSPLLTIFMDNLIDKKIYISLDDFILLSSLNQGSFFVFESQISQMHSKNIQKIDLISQLISEEIQNKSSESLKLHLANLKNAFVYDKKKKEQYKTILSLIFDIRCELISRPANKIKLTTLLAEIESVANVHKLFDQSCKSLKSLLDFLNSVKHQKFDVSTKFANCENIQELYEKINKFQLIELSKFFEADLIENDFFDEMKNCFENVFNSKSNSEIVSSLVEIQLLNNHRCIPEDEEEKQDEISFETTRNKKIEEFDRNLQKRNPPRCYNDCIDNFLEFMHNEEIGGELPKTLSKDMIAFQFKEIVEIFNEDKTNSPIKGEIDYFTNLFNQMSMVVTQINSLASRDNGSESSNQSSMFLSVYISTINILLLAKEKFEKYEDQYEQVLHAFRELVPPLSVVEKMLNIEGRTKKLEQAAEFIKNPPEESSWNEENDSESKNDDAAEIIENKRFNDAYVSFFGSQKATNKLVIELNLSSFILSFLEVYQKFLKFIDCTSYSEGIWSNKQSDDSEQKEIFYCNESIYNASMSLLTLFKIKGFNFDYSPEFFINWITFDFSSINRNIIAKDLIDIVPFCDYSDLVGVIIDSCLYVELYARISNSENMISAAESLKSASLCVFTGLNGDLRFDDIQLTASKQVRTCIKESSFNPNLYKKINVFCRNVLSKIYCFFQIIEFVRYVKIISSTNDIQFTSIEIINISIEIMKKMKFISQCESLAPDFREKVALIGDKLCSIIQDPETTTRPLLFSQSNNELLNKLMPILNKARKAVNKFDNRIIAEKVASYFDEVLSFYESQESGDGEGEPNELPLDIFSIIYSMKSSVDDLIYSDKLIKQQVSIIRIQTILEKAEKTLPIQGQSLDEFKELISVSFLVFSIKTMLNISYFSLTQYEKNGAKLPRWFESEFSENSIFCKEDENIDPKYTNCIEYLTSVVNTTAELQKRINVILNDSNLQTQYGQILNYLNDNYQRLAVLLKNKTNQLKEREIPLEVKQLEQECEKLFQQLATYPENSTNYLSVCRKNKGKTFPISNQLITRLDSTRLSINLKNQTINEMENKIKILQKELSKKEIQMKKDKENSLLDIKKKKKERTGHLISVLKNYISFKKALNSEMGETSNSQIDPSSAQTIEKLKNQLNDLNNDNLSLKRQIRDLENSFDISKEGQIDLLMNKSCNFPVFALNDDLDKVEDNESRFDKSSGEFLTKQVLSLRRSIENIKNKIAIDKQNGSKEESFVKLLKEIRPKGIHDALISEEAFKQAVKSTRKRADALMKEWRALRDELYEYEKNSE